jgi:Spy/CpxP family protein refolding chaperone
MTQSHIWQWLTETPKVARHLRRNLATTRGFNPAARGRRNLCNWPSAALGSKFWSAACNLVRHSPVGDSSTFSFEEPVMRFRVVVVLSAMAVMCLASVAMSQQRPGGRGQGGGFGFGTSRLSLVSIEAVQKELGLEPAQIEAIQKLREELRPMRDGGKGRPGNRGKGKAPEASNRVPADWYFVQAQGQPGQRGQLTPEQIEEFRKQAAERAKQEKAKLAEILLPNQMKRLNEIYIQQLGTRALDDADVAEELKITDEQKASIAKVREESQAQMRELFTAGAGGGDREANRAKFAEARKATDDKILAVLTADQKAKLEELKGKPFEMPENAGRGPGGPGGAPGRRPAGGANNSGE